MWFNELKIKKIYTDIKNQSRSCKISYALLKDKYVEILTGIYDHFKFNYSQQLTDRNSIDATFGGLQVI